MSARSPRRRRSSGWLGRQRPIRAIHPRADGTPPGMRLAGRVNGTMKTSLRCWLAGSTDIVLLASAKNILPYVFAVGKEIKRIQDLKGKVVGISQIGGRAGEIARMVIKNNGLDPDKDVIYLAVGGTVSRLAALSGGR